MEFIGERAYHGNVDTIVVQKLYVQLEKNNESDLIDIYEALVIVKRMKMSQRK